MGVLKALQIPCFPRSSLQQSLRRHRPNPSNTRKASQRAHLAELDTLFASLQSRAFPGRSLSRYGISANFAFLKQEFPHAAESASYAERHVYGDPRASCFHARHALERLVKRVYKVEKTLNPPKVTNLDAYLSEPAFRALVPEVVWQKAEYIRQAGNVAVHGNKAPAPEQALNVVRELAHVLYWAGRTYLRKGAESLHGKTFDESLVPTREPGAAPASVEELDALKRRPGRSRRRAQGGRRRVGGAA